MKFFAAIITLIAATVVKADQPTWTSCNSTADLTVSSFSVDPYPLCVGKNVCATIVGTLSAPITAPSTLSIVGTYFGVTIYKQFVDLCALVSCPVAQNTTTLEVCFPFLSTIPTGIPFVYTFSAANGNEDSLFCQTATVIFTTC
ncbi:hypothetical protein BGX21_003897 [Mortierella sp. AD011]|nr:hypothetical protein BGX21_003897 [Mortierella sp. AD011]